MEGTLWSCPNLKKKNLFEKQRKIQIHYQDNNVELKKELLRSNGLTFSLIKNEYIYTKNGHCHELPKTQKQETILELGNYNKNQKLELITRV